MNPLKSSSKKQILSALDDYGYVQLEPVKADDPDSYLLNVVSSFSEPTCYFRQPLVMNLRPRKGADPASYAGAGGVGLHTDRSYVANPPRYIAMMCVEVGTDGGIPIISDGWKSLSELDRETIEELQIGDYDFKEAADSNRVGYTGPIISESNRRYHIRFREDLIVQSRNKAIEAFYKAVEKYAMKLSISPGMIWIMDNYRVLHGRTLIRDGPRSNRLLKRVYSNSRR